MIAAFSVTPLGAGESVSELVADAVRIVRQSGLPHKTNAMFTNIEGEWDEVLAVIRACTEKVGEGAPRVSVIVKLDYRPSSGPGRMTRDVESIERWIASSPSGSSGA